MKLESKFQSGVKKELKKIPLCWHFTKEALSLRGIPDIIGCVNGRFFAWELKRSRKESEKTTGRIVLQRYILKQICAVGGVGRMVHPDNLQDSLEELRKLSQSS